MKIKDLIKSLEKLDLEKDIFITVPDTNYFTDFSFDTEIDDTVFSSFDKKVGWYYLSEIEKKDIVEHYVLNLWV